MKLTPEALIAQFGELSDWQSRYRYMVMLGDQLPPYPEQEKNAANLVHGCESSIWLLHTVKADRHFFLMTSEARIIRGLLTVILVAIQGQTASFIMDFDLPGYLQVLGLARHLSVSRSSGLQKVFQTIQTKIQAG